jgi:hypothetical protein
MDSQEAANLAQIQNIKLSRWLVFLAIIQIVSPFVYLWLSKSPDPSTVPAGGIVMPPWLPAAFFVSSFAVTTISLIIVASKRWRHKHLTADVAALTTLVTNLKKERQQAWDKANNAVKDAAEANRIANHEKGQKEITDERLRDAETQLANLAWLKRLAEEQAKNIAEHVTGTLLTDQYPGKTELNGDRFLVTVRRKIRN